MTAITEQALITADADLGYWLDPTAAADFAGHHQLWIWLRAAPTQRHYDPEQVECHVLTYGGFTESLTLHHPWVRSPRYRFCIGGINLNDRKQRRLHFYTFGGELTVEETVAGATLCRFVSPAPILALSEQNPLTTVFVEEVAATLAEARATWDVQQRHGDFGALLGAAAPLALYCVCLRATAEHLRPLHSDVVAPEHQLVHFAERERVRLAKEGGCNATPATLVELLTDGHITHLNGGGGVSPNG
jgi:hypothetical protein